MKCNEVNILRELIKDQAEKVNNLKSIFGKKKFYYVREPIIYEDLKERPNYKKGYDILFRNHIFTYRAFLKFLVDIQTHILLSTTTKSPYIAQYHYNLLVRATEEKEILFKK